MFNDHETGQGGGLLTFLKLQRNLDKQAAIKWLQENKHIPPGANTGAKMRIVDQYSYLDASGALRFQVVRLDPKDFRQRIPNGTGGWNWKLGNTQKVVYRLPQVIAAVAAGKTIYIAEGEKAVHSLESIGLVGTCSPGGAGKWKALYNGDFAGANVVVLADNDVTGQDHAANVGQKLISVAQSVRAVMLPNLPPKGDVADWIAAGGTREELEALAAGVPPVSADSFPTPEDRENPFDRADEPEWYQYLQRDEKGDPLNNLANAMTAMREAPELRNCFRYDEMLRAPILAKPVPRGRDGDLPSG